MNFNSNKCENTNRTAPAGRSGFSLLEILVVMAVFVMISAIAVPSMSRAWTGHQLKSSADEIRGRFSAARVKAIQTGDIYGFFYQPGKGDYFIAPMVQGFRSIQSGIDPSGQSYELEHELVFVEGDTNQDSRSEMAVADSGQQYGTMRPVLFYPDGTSQDAVVLLKSPKTGGMIQVSLRGLTGSASTSGIISEERLQK